MTAILSLASGLGGALIGGVAGVYGPRSIDKRRRQHEWALEMQRLEIAEKARNDEAHERERVAEQEARWRERVAEQEARERERVAEQDEKEKVLAAITEAIVSVQDWERLIAWALQDISAGRGVDARQFDEAAEQTLQDVVRAIPMLSNNPSSVDPLVHGPEARQPVTLAMQQLTLELRSQIDGPRDASRNGDMAASARRIRDDLMEAFISERSSRTGRPPARVGLIHSAAIEWTPRH